VIWHVVVDGVPACCSTLLAAGERLEPPLCGCRHRQRAEEYAAMLREAHLGVQVEVLPGGCDVRGE